MKTVALASGVGDIDQIKAVLADMGGNVQASIEFLLATAGDRDGGAGPPPHAAIAELAGGDVAAEAEVALIAALAESLEGAVCTSTTQ